MSCWFYLSSENDQHSFKDIPQGATELLLGACCETTRAAETGMIRNFANRGSLLAEEFRGALLSHGEHELAAVLTGQGLQLAVDLRATHRYCHGKFFDAKILFAHMYFERGQIEIGIRRGAIGAGGAPVAIEMLHHVEVAIFFGWV